MAKVEHQIALVEAICIKDKETKFPTGTVLSAEVTLEGFVGDVHYGFTRGADSRDVGIKRGTPVRNWRQWSAVSVEELRTIAEKMGIEKIEPWMLAANLTFSGIENFTGLARGTELRFEGGTILTVECENAPCMGPGREVARANEGHEPQEFVKKAMHLRGVVGVVYLPGMIKVGEQAKVVLPR
jgi:MOSC domain-containing protein YiiM